MDVPSRREIIPFITLASGELAGQRGQGLNILDNTGLFAMVLTVILALHEGQPPWLTIQ
jgi:hypothetical protein